MRPYRILFSLASVAVVLSAAPLRAEIIQDGSWTIAAFTGIDNTVFVPGGFAGVEGSVAATEPFGHTGATALRLQQVFAAADFGATGPVVLQDVRFRADAVLGHFADFTLPEIQVRLATTPLGPGQLGTNQNANFAGASNALTVDDGVFRVHADYAVVPGGPEPFIVEIMFVNLYNYDPTKGNLLLDIYVPTLPVGSDALFLDATDTSAAGSRVLALDANVVQPSVPEPTSLVLLGAGSVVALIYRRSRG